MQVEEFLDSAREAEQEIERLEEKLMRLEARARRVTAVYRQTGGGSGNGPEDVWVQLVQQRERLAQRMQAAAQQQEQVEEFLTRLGQVRLRFLNYLTIEEAAKRMGYSYDAAKKLSARAMRAARTIWQAEHGTH